MLHNQSTFLRQLLLADVIDTYRHSSTPEHILPLFVVIAKKDDSSSYKMTVIHKSHKMIIYAQNLTKSTGVHSTNLANNGLPGQAVNKMSGIRDII